MFLLFFVVVFLFVFLFFFCFFFVFVFVCFLFVCLLFFCPPPFRRKAEGHCFWFSVGRGVWYVARGAWFRIFSRYLVPLTPPTVFVRSF